MAIAYEPTEWSSLFAATTSASAALTGLLFIALSLGPRAILNSPEHRGRAREALGQFLAVLVVSVAVLIPGQARLALGIELLTVCGVVVAASARFQTETVRTLPPPQRPRWLLRLVIPDLATVGVGVAGVSLIMTGGGGLYWLVAAVVIYLGWSCINTWQLIASDAASQPQ